MAGRPEGIVFEIRPSAGYTQTLRCALRREPGTLGRLTSAIGEAGGDIEALEIVGHRDGIVVRDISVMAADEDHAARIADAAREVEGVRVIRVTDRIFDRHLGGKLRVASTVGVRSRDDLSMAYTPGVGRVAEAIAADRSLVWDLTIRSNAVAVLSNGSAVLGLGDAGPLAALPVMEGKAVLFREFAGIDAFPLCVDAPDVDALVAVGRALAPTFGGINLEDIAAPDCFEVERRLKEALDIPVFHDDQHGTAITVLAALSNAARVVERPLRTMRVVVQGLGAAGVAVLRLLRHAGVGDVVATDEHGIVSPDRAGLAGAQAEALAGTNRDGRTGDTADALVDADVFVGVSAPGTVEPEWIAAMRDEAIVFALSNPVPEIMPERLPDTVAVVATGRSDYPNQINNVLVFPGVFRGLLDARARHIDLGTERAAADALAAIVGDEERSAEYIVPSPFDDRVVPAVADAVREAATASARGDAADGPGADPGRVARSDEGST